MKDEYIRDFFFDPEFIRHKNSVVVIKDQFENNHTTIQKRLQKSCSVDKTQSHSDDELSENLKKNNVDDEVYSFCTVNIFFMILRQ